MFKLCADLALTMYFHSVGSTASIEPTAFLTNQVINHCQQCLVHIALTKMQIADQCRVKCECCVYM